MKKINILRKDQSGLAAITVSVFVLIVLTLVVLAFSQISRREQRQSLDRQLSTAAFYAAESGINDATNYVRNPATAADVDKIKCEDPPAFNANLDTSGIFKESCVLFDRAPTSLEYSAIDSYRGELISLQTTSGTPRSVTIEWKETNNDTPDFSTCTDPADILKFPKQQDYNCPASMLKLVFMPVINGSISREQLVNDSFYVFLRPVKGTTASTVSYSPHSGSTENQGSVSPADCTSFKCKATITGIPPSNGLFLRISSPYSKSATSITGFDQAGVQARYNEAQVKIDSTGKANDVLKRLQVRIPLYERYQTAPYALEAMNGICKRLDVYPGYANNDDCGGIN